MTLIKSDTIFKMFILISYIYHVEQMSTESATNIRKKNYPKHTGFPKISQQK